jgi:periplasmic protein TonB
MSYNATKTPAERFSGIAFVVVFHLIIVYGLAVGLGHDPMKLVKQQIDAKIIEEQAPPEEEAPPPPPPDFVPPPPDFVPPPDIAFAPDIAPANTSAITVSKKPVEVKVTQPRPPKKGLSRPPYPSASLRLGEEGVVGLTLYLDETGKVRDGKVESSSGFERLDTSALKHAIRVWKFEPCTKSNQPVACWHRIKFRFQIDQK